MNVRQQKKLRRATGADRAALESQFAAENKNRHEQRQEAQLQRYEKQELAQISRNEGHPFAKLMREVPSPRDRSVR